MTSTTTMRTAAADVGLSIVVPVYNEGRGLRAFHDRLCDVARALRQKRGLATEVVYVDDGSRDDSLAVAQALAARMGLADKIFTVAPKEAAKELLKGSPYDQDKPHKQKEPKTGNIVRKSATHQIRDQLVEGQK